MIRGILGIVFLIFGIILAIMGYSSNDTLMLKVSAFFLILGIGLIIWWVKSQKSVID